MKPGDVIGFSGRSLESAAINLATCGVPLRGISHVGIIVDTGRFPCLLESNTQVHRCVMSGLQATGVKAYSISRRIDAYRGRVWHYPLYRALYSHESERLTAEASTMLGREYDYRGALCAGGIGLAARFVSMLRLADLASLFCSECAVSLLSAIGVFPADNPGRYSPNGMIRTLRACGVLCKPTRCK